MIAKLYPILLWCLLLFTACTAAEEEKQKAIPKIKDVAAIADAESAETPMSAPNAGNSTQKPDWKAFEEGESLAKSSGKKVLVYVYDPDCSNCAEMEAGTFSHPVINRLLKDHFVAIKLNGRSRETITARGRVFKPREIPGTEPFHELALALTKAKDALELPAVVFMDKDLNMIEVLKGTISERRMEVLLKYIGENHWPNVDAKLYADTLSKEIQ